MTPSKLYKLDKLPLLGKDIKFLLEKFRDNGTLNVMKQVMEQLKRYDEFHNLNLILHDIQLDIDLPLVKTVVNAYSVDVLNIKPSLPITKKDLEFFGMTPGDKLLEQKVMNDYNKKLFGNVRRALGMNKTKERKSRKSNRRKTKRTYSRRRRRSRNK